MDRPPRDSRRSGRRGDDPRSPFERDRDRILHCSAFRRLAGVTQVVDPAEGHVFHNRLTHSLKVAQIARRLAQRLLDKDPKGCQELGGLDPDVVETAALAHDLDHPPFGHVAERRLNELVDEKNEGGFEGNAQTFRIVTKLALKAPATFGLDLTRASLNAILKYPWLRGKDPKKNRKWGAYSTESDAFEDARALAPSPKSDIRSLEAEVMNIADDIAYAIHDLEDFYRAGLIPLEILWSDPDLKRDSVDSEREWISGTDERERFLEMVFAHWTEQGKTYDKKECRSVLEALVVMLPMTERYRGTRRQRVTLRQAVSFLIGQYVAAVEVDLNKPGIRLNNERYDLEISLLKQLTWQYVIKSPALGTQQYGRRHVIGELFKIYFEALGSSEWDHIVPVRFREANDPDGTRIPPARRVADIVSSLTDYEALAAFRRLTGQSLDSLLRYGPT